MAIEPKSTEECRHLLRPGIYEFTRNGVSEPKAEAFLEECVDAFKRDGFAAARHKFNAARAESRIAALEAALLEIAAEVEHAHDGAHIFRVREICAKALAR